jgi:hypothetical protein
MRDDQISHFNHGAGSLPNCAVDHKNRRSDRCDRVSGDGSLAAKTVDARTGPAHVIGITLWGFKQINHNRTQRLCGAIRLGIRGIRPMQ